MRYLIVFLLFYNKAYAIEHSDSYSTTAKITCNSTEITATTTCISGDLAGYPVCQTQEFGFHRENGKSITIKAEGLLIKPESQEAEMLDYLASAWTCATGMNGIYLIVNYYNGGNCSECEFYEIYDLNGTKLTKKRRKSFDITTKKLKIIGGWSKNLKEVPFSK